MFEFYLNLFDQKKLSTNDYIHSFAQFINLNGIIFNFHNFDSSYVNFLTVNFLFNLGPKLKEFPEIFLSFSKFNDNSK